MGILLRTVVFQSDHRQIIKLRRFFDKGVYCGADARQYFFLRSSRRDSVESVDGAFCAEQFIIRVGRLGNAVGVDKDAVALACS